MKEIGRSGTEAYLKRAVRAAGGVTRKWVSPGRNNVPDQIVIWPGGRKGDRRPKALVHFVETKATSKGARPAQAREHKRLRDLGCGVFVLNAPELIDQYVEQFK